jgi:CDP-glucose 4,6-dehydratase
MGRLGRGWQVSLRSFYKGKRVLVTGHTGFKGSWLCHILSSCGAKVSGYALPPSTSPNLFDLCHLSDRIDGVYGDVRDIKSLEAFFSKQQPEIVFHMAAQPIVRESYRTPRETYETNVMGTVNVLECVRRTPSVRSFLNVTTDKVYANDDSGKVFSEDDPLDGFDPYSNSKSCSELVTHCYRASFFGEGRCVVSTARAGNVIGGGDFAADRIIPDCVRAVSDGRSIVVRNPGSTRPYQHVLEPLSAYMMIASLQMENPEKAGWYNVGPDDGDSISTGDLVDIFCRVWGEGALREDLSEINAPHEAEYLRLSTEKIRRDIGWRPQWSIENAVSKVCEFSRVWLSGGDVAAEMTRQMEEYFDGASF